VKRDTEGKRAADDKFIAFFSIGDFYDFIVGEKHDMGPLQ
jgi:hypothetical protein